MKSRYVSAAFVVAVGAILATALRPGGGTPPTADSLRLSLLRAAAGDADSRASDGRPASIGGRNVVSFPRGTTARAAPSRAGSPPTFGQPTIAGIGGWGFEADLRLDPTDREPRLRELARLGRLRHELDLALARRRPTFKWVPAAAPLERQGDRRARAAATPSSPSTGAGASTSTTSRSRTSASRAPTTSGATLHCLQHDRRARTPASTGSGTRSTATRTAGGLALPRRTTRSAPATCSAARRRRTTCSSCTARRSRRRGRTAGVAFGPPNRITQPGLVRRGDHGQRRGQPGRDEDRPARQRRRRRRSRRPSARLRDPRRRQPEQDPDRPLLPGRVRRARSRTSATRAASNCVDLPGREPRRPERRPHGRELPVARDRPAPATSTRVWEQAPMSGGKRRRQRRSMYAYSTNEGTTWSTPIRSRRPASRTTSTAGSRRATTAASTSPGTARAAHVDLGRRRPARVPERRARRRPRLVEPVPDADAERARERGQLHDAGPRGRAPDAARRASRRSWATSAAARPTRACRARTATLGDFFQLRIGEQGRGADLVRRLRQRRRRPVSARTRCTCARTAAPACFAGKRAERRRDPARLGRPTRRATRPTTRSAQSSAIDAEPRHRLVEADLAGRHELPSGRDGRACG